jgi:hypothetical protein
MVKYCTTLVNDKSDIGGAKLTEEEKSLSHKRAR